MSTTKSHEVVYEPIDSRTLSKKEKIHYLTTFMRKPLLDRKASFSLPNSEDSDSEFELDEPLPEIQQRPPPSPPSRPAPRKSLMPDPPKNRAEAELRKLDEFWSFKPIPRDASLVCHSPSRATFGSPSPPRSSSPSYSSGSEVDIPVSLSPHCSNKTNTPKGRSEPKITAELVDIGPDYDVPRTMTTTAGSIEAILDIYQREGPLFVINTVFHRGGETIS